MLRMLLNRILLKRNRGSDHPQTEMRAAFAVRYRDVRSACQELKDVIDLPPEQLARRYMSSILAERHDEVWWKENFDYLTEQWFIYDYGLENGLIEQSEKATDATVKLYPIEPETAEYEGYVKIRVVRNVGDSACGKVLLEYAQADDAFRELARSMRFACREDRSARKIDETGSGICDRAVEAAISLLQRGYRICVEEAALRERILEEAFEPEHPYWVTEGSALDKLELRYPRDRQLHEYVYKAGGRWNGKTMEISICSAHLLDDVIRLYGFRMTKGAKLRMEAWRETLEQVTIYRSRKRKDDRNEIQPVDRFKEMMDRKPQRIDDLYENDE